MKALAQRLPFYYGWVIVAVLFAVEFFTYATTGSTISACASALKSAGAASVWGLVLAREA